MTRFTTLLLGVALVALAIAPAAGASSVAYIAGDGNLHIISPDGSRDKQLTTDATADSKYRSPSQIDDGRVVALRRASGTSSFAIFLDRNDGHALDSWLLPSSGVSGFAPQGVMVAPRPTQSGGLGTQCQLDMKLVAPGGKEPDWGVADVPAAPQTETPKKVEDRQPPKVKLTGPDVAAIGKARSKGLAVGFRCSEACKVSAVASVSKAVAKRLHLGAAKTKVGSGKASPAKAGAGSVRIAFTAKAKQLLDDAASVPVNVALKLTDRAGSTRTLTKTVTLK